MNKNSTDCLIKTVCGVFLYAYRGLRRNKAQCAEEVYKICYDNTTEEKEMRDRFFRVPEYFFGKCLMSFSAVL